MKQTVSPTLFITIIVVAVVAVAGVMVWVWRAPSAVAIKPPAGQSLSGMGTPAQVAEQRGPNQDQAKMIQEWKKKNPGAYTQY